MKNYLYYLSIAQGVKNAFDSEVKPQFKSIVGDVVLPVICGILLVALIIRGIMMGVKYKRGDDISWTMLIILFFGLVVGVTVNAWMWGIIGW